MKLSIIIISYNTKDVLADCLNSIYSAEWTSSFEVIVVDNNSQDGSVEMLYDKYPQVKVIANTDNKLFAIANNQGVKIAKGEYLLLLNSDTLVWSDNLQKMINYFDSVPQDVICIGPKLLNKDRSLQSCGMPHGGYREKICMCLKLHKIFPPRLIEFLFHIKGIPQDTEKTREVGWVSGACMMMRAALYNAVGGLNENIEFYGEEPEFGYRTSKLGYKTLYFPESEIIHLGGSSTKRERERERERERDKEETRFRRYCKLQEETVGYTKAIRLSKIVVFIANFRRMFSKNKKSWNDAIGYEKRLIKYMKAKRELSRSNN